MFLRTLIIAALLGGCHDKPEESGEADSDTDTDTDTDTDSDADLVEAANFIHVQDCVGCEKLLLFGLPPKTGFDLVSVDFCVNSELVAISAHERIHTAIRSLNLDSCEILDLSEISDLPQYTCLDAGLVSIEADWAGWAFPALPYTSGVSGYPSQIVWDESMGEYTPGRSVTISAAGGEDIDGFTTVGTSADPLRLISPAVDGDVVVNMSFDQPLEVLWSGGDGSDIGIYLYGQWASIPGEPSLLACRASNDGQFSITLDSLSLFDPGEVADLRISDRRVGSLGVPEVAGAGWTLGALAYTYVYYNPLN